MAQIIQLTGFGVNGDTQAQVDNYHHALRVSNRPWEHDGGGQYRASARSAAITGAAVVAGGVLYAFQWNVTGMVAIILRVRAFWIPTVVFTAAQEIGLDMVRLTNYLTPYTAGAAVTPSKMRSAMPVSAVSDLRIAPATILTAPPALPTFDASPIEIGGGLVNVVNAAAATAYVNPNSGGTPQFGFDYEAHVERGEFPLTLMKGEGFAVRNTVGFPAAGAATLVVSLVHLEVPVANSVILPP